MRPAQRDCCAELAPLFSQSKLKEQSLQDREITAKVLCKLDSEPLA